ncbi:OsmC family protein [Pseudotamlana carrageenivorans]|uniref:Osmotically inducible protein OsmC n=1 Tax=Pseudotamlana carrageenivorans TaxID=2069432 RepID=A0A2I7SKU2_9FLAO|nr:OsmC family protein [Tamlana carrageenivorans]AUS06500.1 osmotically inducible protein OsmC [Tamlana carrageenivorans]
MLQNHKFKAHVRWELTEGDSTTNPRNFSRKHSVTVSNKAEELQISAAKAFRGDERCFNPEDLLLSALASCHMMSYLYVCAQHKIEVLSYSDDAEGILAVNTDGSGQFTGVHLKPVVTIKDKSQKDLALGLHEKANALCFIANSCNFPISHQGEVVF